MEVTKEYLIRKIADSRRATIQLRRDADATDGAAQAYEQLLKDLEAQEKPETKV